MQQPKPHQPYVPAESRLPELTLRAVVLGVLMAVILGAANAYLGLRAGLTVSATFPAAVVAMAVLRLIKGSVLEENIARTAGSSGEALVAGAIFTIPAFIISGAWSGFHYWESTLIMMVGGILGVLFIVLLRRPLVAEGDLPFPESVATAEIVKAGQGGATGARYVFGSLGFAALIEFFKNANGLRLFSESASYFLPFSVSRIFLLGKERVYTSGLYLESPSASPALVGVGFIVGPQISSVLVAGAMMGWFLLVPLGMFLNPELAAAVASGASWVSVA
ncbi:MAG: oligopeptide transporter, OPT family, partial [Acidobacteria bacterium]|nr:oligopeptide transporter, OPT family [Acidobacteriota bacterium]